jgi:hypothetical protein
LVSAYLTGLHKEAVMEEATKYVIYFDDTKRLPYSYELINDDEEVVFKSSQNTHRFEMGQYRTKQACASAAARKLKCLS